jgi:hypothetical protein
MLRHVEVVGDLADRAECIWGLVENGLISFERGRLSSPSAAVDPDKVGNNQGIRTIPHVPQKWDRFCDSHSQNQDLRSTETVHRAIDRIQRSKPCKPLADSDALRIRWLQFRIPHHDSRLQ